MIWVSMALLVSLASNLAWAVAWWRARTRALVFHRQRDEAVQIARATLAAARGDLGPLASLSPSAAGTVLGLINSGSSTKKGPPPTSS